MENDFYIGTLRQGKYTRKRINGPEIKKDELDHIVFENHHEAIIDKQTFAMAQEQRKKRTRSNYRGIKKYDNVYSGFLYCGDCGSPVFSMSRSDLKPAYLCGTYHKRGRKGCTSHHIRVDLLDGILKEYILKIRGNSGAAECVFEGEEAAEVAATIEKMITEAVLDISVPKKAIFFKKKKIQFFAAIDRKNVRRSSSSGVFYVETEKISICGKKSYFYINVCSLVHNNSEQPTDGGWTQRRTKNMRATGIVRRIDDLGRVVIPKEIRRTLRIREGDPSQIILSEYERFGFAMIRLEERWLGR